MRKYLITLYRALNGKSSSGQVNKFDIPPCKYECNAHSGIEPCLEQAPSPGRPFCLRNKGHEGKHMICGDKHAYEIW